MRRRKKRARPNRKKGPRGLEAGDGDGASEVRSDHRHRGTKNPRCNRRPTRRSGSFRMKRDGSSGKANGFRLEA